MSLISKALAGSQLNWHRQEKNQPICRGLIRNLVAWSQGHWMIWSLFLLKTPWSWRSRKICSTMMARERGAISPDDKWYALGGRGWIQTDRREKEGKDIIYTYVTPKPADEKSHLVRPSFDACCPQMRQLADIVWVRRLFDQHFRRDININVW